MNMYRVAVLCPPRNRGKITLDRTQVLSVYCWGENEHDAERAALHTFPAKARDGIRLVEVTPIMETGQ